jgi:serine/threonine protein kinase
MRDRSIDAMVRARGPFPAIEATRTLRLAVEALKAAHDRGNAHGNIKPTNIFVAGGGLVKIADFAPPVEKPEESSAEGSSESTHQSTAARKAMSHDLRAMSAVYQFLLTGRTALDEPGAMPPICRWVVDRALGRPPGSEFESAAEFSTALLDADESLRLTETAPIQSPGDAVGESRESWQLWVAPTRPARSFPEVGQVLGKCLLLERIGQGSAGVVFKAKHQSLNILVAVKVLNLAKPGEMYRQLRSEAQLLAQLNHPNIVRVWDFEDDPVLPYLVLEFVEGPSVIDLIRRNGPLPLGRAIQVIRQVAAGLAAAHKLGVVHRDVKPGNILLTSDGIAKLADLGLAVLVDAAENGSKAPGLAGTVAYMPPEQATSKNNIDLRSDIYALGASFYHMATGHIPFQGVTRMEVILKHAQEPIVPPNMLSTGVTPAASNLIAKMMAKSPTDRFQTYEELEWALSELEPAAR